MYNTEEIPNLHIHTVYGLDVSVEDLKFAVEGTAPPPPEETADEAGSPGYRSYVSGVQRWEGLVAKLWHGGLEVINEELVGVECIVSTEVCVWHVLSRTACLLTIYAGSSICPQRSSPPSRPCSLASTTLTSYS